MDYVGELFLEFSVWIEGEFVGACRRGGAFYKGIVSTPARRGPYFSMKKSRQKSLGEDPETPNASVHPARKRYAFPERD